MAAQKQDSLVDQEQLKKAPTHREHWHSKESPSQKTFMPRWHAKGKEKSSVALACTWIVDHQISMHSASRL